MNKNAIETIVGFIVLAVCILFIFIIYSTGIINKNYKETYNINAIFERADGIDIGSEVSISGIPVGKVLKKELNKSTYAADIVIQIDKSVQLPLDTSAEITTKGLMGDKYISIVPGSEKEFLQNNDTIEFTQSSVNLESMIGKFAFGLENGSNNAVKEEESKISSEGESIHNSEVNSKSTDSKEYKDLSKNPQLLDGDKNKKNVSNENINNQNIENEDHSNVVGEKIYNKDNNLNSIIIS